MKLECVKQTCQITSTDVALSETREADASQDSIFKLSSLSKA